MHFALIAAVWSVTSLGMTMPIVSENETVLVSFILKVNSTMASFAETRFLGVTSRDGTSAFKPGNHDDTSV